jgi:redox-sensing transcriptional repressor
VKRIADSTVRRLSVYLRYLEELAARDIGTTSSEELAQYGGTTSAQVRKDLSFFGSFGTRGLGYSVAELSAKIREILGLGREWKVVIIGAGKIGSALSAYRGFAQRGFVVVGVYDNDPSKVGRPVGRATHPRHQRAGAGRGRREARHRRARDPGRRRPGRGRPDRARGHPAILNFAPAQVQAPPGVTIKTVNMAMELEGLSYALRHRDE